MKALDLANYIISKCNEDDHLITNLQLQKILFYIQKEFIVNKNNKAFDDRIEAWKFGPVVPKVYYEYSSYGSLPILDYKKGLDKEVKHFLSEDEIKVIDAIIEDKRKLDPWDLVEETHRDGGAWDNVYNNILRYDKEITFEDILKYEK